MTGAPLGRPVRTPRLPLPASGRLLRVEVRRNAMLWMVPVAAALFWLITYRRSMALPPLWNVRTMSMQTGAVSVFAATVVGVAAWTGSREGRHAMTDLLAGTARPRWIRQLAAWSATTCWALLAYLGCVGVLYAATAWQAAWGDPLWWPAAVGAASVPAFSAIGFTAGVLRPSRFTAPLVAVIAFLALQFSVQMIHGGRSPWQISPLVAGPWQLGPDAGVATFYPYVPDLPLAQVSFLAGLTAALLGCLGLPAGSGGSWLRRSAAAITAAGLLSSGAAVALAGTGRLDTHGMIAIPTLHDVASDRPIPYTPVCSQTTIPVCLHPAYAIYLPAVTAALEPLLSEVAGLPGAPVRISQTSAAYRQQAGNGVGIGLTGPLIIGTPPVFQLLLPNQLGGPTMTADEVAAAVRSQTRRDILAGIIGGERAASPAQQAVLAAMLDIATAPDTPIRAKAVRFAALSTAARHAWLVKHLPALRTGRLTLAQLP
jgi:hypothetical protein